MHLLKSVLSLALLAGSALAQGTQILSPAPGSTLTAGSNVTMQILSDDFIENVDVIAIVIGLVSCSNGVCPPPNETMGDVLYQGPYTPMLPFLYDNYTVTVPVGFPAGTASINVINLYLIGLALYPVLDFASENVTVVA